MLDTKNSIKRNDIENKNEKSNQINDLFQSRLNLNQNRSQSQRFKKRIIRSNSELNFKIKEGIHLLDFFRNEDDFGENHLNVKNNSYNNNNNNSNSKPTKIKRNKFRAEVLYYPLIHGDLKKADMRFKNCLPSKLDIESEREINIYREGRRVFVPTNNRVNIHLVYKNYTHYDIN